MATDLQGEHTLWQAAHRRGCGAAVYHSGTFIHPPSPQNFIKGETTEYSPLFHHLIG